MTAAARSLKITQPTLTVAMKNLEERFRTTLLNRSHNGVTLTPMGQALLSHTSEVFSAIERAEARISGLEAEDVGSFTIGCYESLGAYFLPGFMSRFLREAPRIEIALRNKPSAQVWEDVVAQGIDFGLVVNPAPHPDLVIVDLFKDAVDVFVRAADDGTSGVRTLDEAHARLREGPLIFAGRVGQSHELIGRLSADSLRSTRMLSCGDLELVKSLAIEGIGVGILPRRVAAYGQPGKLVRLHPELPTIPDVISLLYRADRYRTRAATRLKDALIAHGKRLNEADEGR